MDRSKVFLRRVYDCSPIILQNFAISLLGGIHQRQRFGGIFKEQLLQAENRKALTREALEEYQFTELVRFISFADKNSAYYNEVFKKIGFTPADLRSVHDLSLLPILEKSDLQKHSRDIQSVPDSKIIHRIKTSGTTGTPLSAGFIARDLQTRFAFLYRMLGEYGITYRSKSVRFSGGTFFPNAEKNHIFWRHSFLRNQLFMSSYHLKKEFVVSYIDKLRSFKPDLIDGYPSAIYLIAQQVIESSRVGEFMPKVFMCTGETLEDYQRDVIKTAFPGSIVLNQYASAEGAPFITQDIKGNLVVNTDSGVFEFFRPGTMEPAKPGEIAELVVTSFTTHAFPLIRYRIGDTVRLSDQCSKDCPMPIVSGIYGRRDDLVYTKYRGWVGRLSPAIKAGPETIREAQVQQLSDNAFVLRIVPSASFRRADADIIINELKNRLGPVDINIELHERGLSRGPNGKLRSVIGLPRHSREHN